MLDMRPVPMDDPVVIVVAIVFFAFAVFCNVVLAPPPRNQQGQRVETQRKQGRFHPVAYGILLLMVLLALGVV